MKVQAFAIFDIASETYSAPFFRNTVALAKRDFAEMISQPGLVGKYPEDFFLDRLFSIELDTGEILDSDKFRVVRASDLLSSRTKPTSQSVLEESERSEIRRQLVEDNSSAQF
ncbi:nonstructural protein [Chicken microvirus mg7_14]|nr:nonstructural protein [Chicken microvirus mg7_14]